MKGDIMAEFCLECFNKLYGTAISEKSVTLGEDFCEGCGKVKPCVIDLYPPPWWQRLAALFKK